MLFSLRGRKGRYRCAAKRSRVGKTSKTGHLYFFMFRMRRYVQVALGQSTKVKEERGFSRGSEVVIFEKDFEVRHVAEAIAS